MSKTVYWVKSDGSKISVDNMSDLHVVNTCRMVFRRMGLDYKDMPEYVSEMKEIIKGYVKTITKLRASIEPRRRHSRFPVYNEPWDEHEGCWEDCN